MTADGDVSDEVNPRIMKDRPVYAELGHFRHQGDVSLDAKGRVYNALVRGALLYACETWPLRAEDVWCLYSTIVASEELPTPGRNVMLVMLRFGIVCSGAAMTIQLV